MCINAVASESDILAGEDTMPYHLLMDQRYIFECLVPEIQGRLEFIKQVVSRPEYLYTVDDESSAD